MLELEKYNEIKEKYKNIFILIKNKNFYEAYDDVAEKISKYIKVEVVTEFHNNEKHKIVRFANDEHIELNILLLTFNNTIGIIENDKLTIYPKSDLNEPKYTIDIDKVGITDNKKCLICENKTLKNYLICTDCYSKYKNKTLFLEFAPKDNSIKLLDSSYEGRLECDDGHIVKSQAERDIDNFLFANNIKHCYEIPLIIYDNNKKIELHPDFCVYLNNEKVYIEYWGIEDNNFYEKTKEYKMPLYKKAGITLINMYKKTDLKNINKALEYKLSNYKKGEINFEEI